MKNKTFLMVATALIMSVSIILILYFLSTDLNQRHNNFTRLFPPHPIMIENERDIKGNNYYIAGATTNRVYLGNVKNPSCILILNDSLRDTTEQKVEIQEFKLPKSTDTRFIVDSPYFYIMNGKMSAILRGKVSTWMAQPYLPQSTFFIESIPLGKSLIAIRSVYHTRQNVLGLISETSPKILVKDNILKKQVDGIFCTDGMLHYSEQLSQLTYVYYYRNQFICMDTSMNVRFEGKTIDTISHAKIKVSNVSSENKVSLSAPPLYVNKSSCVAGKYMFIQSTSLSKNESKNLFDKASVIDIYNLKDGTYRFSFYIFDHRGKKVNSFKVAKNKLIAIHDHYVVTYTFNPRFFSKI